MALENKLGITDSTELAKAEERISKTKALEMFQQGLLDTFEVGTFRGLSQIHKYLFDEIYDFAGQVRTVNIAKGGFRFAPVLYLTSALENISRMPQSKSAKHNYVKTDKNGTHSCPSLLCASSCKGCQKRRHIRGFCKEFEKQLLFGCCVKVLKRVWCRGLLFHGRLGHRCGFRCAATPIKLFLESCSVYTAVIV